MVLSILNILISLIIIREMSVQNFGNYSYLLAFVSTASYVSNLGFLGIMQKKIPKISIENSMIYLNKLLHIKLLFVVFMIICFMIVNIFTQMVSERYIYILTAIVLLNSVNSLIMNGYFIIVLWSKFSYFSQIASAIVKLFLIYSIINSDLFYVENVLYIVLAYEALVFIFSINKFKYGVYSPLLNLNKLFNNSKYFIKEKFFELLFLPSIGVFYLRFMYESEVIADYVFVISISLLISSSISILARLEVIVNNIFIKRATFDKYLKDVIKLWFKVFLLISIPFLVITIFFIDEIGLYIFKNKYEEVIYLLPISIGLILFTHIGYIYAPIIYMKDDIIIFSRTSLLVGVSHIIFLSIFGYYYGAIGAIFSIIAAYSIKTFYLIYLYGFILKFRLILKSVLMLSTLSIVVLIALSAIVQIQSVVSLFSIAISAILISIGAGILLNYFSMREISLAKLVARQYL
jgi:O-antigen/teichoic acid export membrane protein